LWSRFSRDFPDVVAAGSHATRQVHQIGGSTDHQVVIIPELQLRLGSFASLLRPGTLFSAPVGDDFHHGNMGTDLLSQAADVTVDFKRMSVTLR